MRVLHGIRKWSHARALRKVLQRSRQRRGSVDWEQARRVGLLGVVESERDLNELLEVKKSLKKLGKQAELLCFVPEKAPVELPASVKGFSSKELDWALRPKAPAVAEFVEKPFHILLSFSRAASIPLQYVAALSRASFRVGTNAELAGVSELIVEAREDQSQDYLQVFREMVPLLQIMRNTHERTT